MKKIFFFALASLALASCSQDEEFAPEKSTNGGSKRANSEVLSFSTYTAGATRADVVTSAEVKASGFQVAAWYDGALYFDPEEKASYTTADELFDTDGDTYYWPSFSAGNIGFRAFNLGTGAAWTENKEYESIDFTVEKTAADQKDLVIAYAEASEKPEDGVQPLNFTHALSKVNFSFIGADTNKYTINKVELIAAGGDAVMSFTADTTGIKVPGADGSQPGKADKEQKDMCSWEFTHINGKAALVVADQTTPANGGAAAQGVLFTYTEGSNVVANVDADNNPKAIDLSENFMLLPQGDSIAVRVYYKVEKLKKGSDSDYNMIGNCGYELTDNEGRHESQRGYTGNGAILGYKTVIIKLGENGIPELEAGKAYRFTLTLPNDNFIGDGAKGNTADGVPDGLDDTDPSNLVDLDGDGDTDNSEFDKLTPIRFSVTVSDWVDYTTTPGNVTIK